jgi:hypothetical protein
VEVQEKGGGGRGGSRGGGGELPNLSSLAGVDLQDHADAFGGKVDGRGGDQQGLDDVLSQHVAHTILAHVDAGRLLAVDVSVAQLGHDLDGVEPGVLRQGVWDGLQCLRECPHTVALHSLQAKTYVHMNLFKRDMFTRDFGPSGTLSFAFPNPSPYKSRWLR